MTWDVFGNPLMEILAFNWKELCFKVNYIIMYVYKYHMYIFYILNINSNFLK